MSFQDANVNQSVFRQDSPLILAMRRDLAAIIAGRLAYSTSDVLAGQVLGRDPADGLFKNWSAVSGTADAAGVLMENVSADQFNELQQGSTSGVSGSVMARVIVAGYVYTAKLINYDAAAKTALGSVDLKDANAVAITKF